MKDNKDKNLVAEIQMLRTEVKQLKEMVNMLVDIVVDLEGDDEEIGAEFGLQFPGKNSKTSFCM